nr:hypothetical protein [uncultured Treponema sp.]
MKLWTPEEKLNYVYAFMKYHGESLTLDFWQDDFILNRNRYICLLKSRQTGFSFVVAIKGLVKALDPARCDYTKQFVSYNMEDAQEKIRYAKEFYESIPKRYKKKLVHITTTMLEFKDYNSNTTSRLISLPCRPPRGKNGDICLDEYAIYTPRLSKEVFTAVSFCTLRRGCIEAGSTPLGAIGRFYEICTDKKSFPGYDRYLIPWWYAKVMCTDVKEAVTQAKDMPTDERVRKFGTKNLLDLYNNTSLEDFQQECECTFVDSAASYISLDLIYANTPGRRDSDIIPAELPDDEYFSDKYNFEIKSYKDADSLIAEYNPRKHGSPLFMGYDVAELHDATAIYVMGIKDGKKRALMRYEKTSVAFDEQKAIVRKLMSSLPIYRACIDCTGMGSPIHKELHKEYGDRIEGIKFTLQSKETLVMGVKFGLERNEFELENDREFHAQIHSIKRTPSTGGSFRYDAERTEKGHADSFWAWALANHAATAQISTPNFYDEYARKKKAIVVNSDYTEELLKNPQQPLTRKRGESLATVLRRVRDGNKR